MRISSLNIKKNGRYEAVDKKMMKVPDCRGNLRQVSLMAGELLPELRMMGGLCTDRYHADIETEGLDYASLSVGDILVFGSVCLEITLKGKRCFEECPLIQSGTTCPLPKQTAFARVIKEGLLEIHAAGAKTFKI